jgi:rare lipoprotein A (peptidoglycan hydrolase)
MKQLSATTAALTAAALAAVVALPATAATGTGSGGVSPTAQTPAAQTQPAPLPQQARTAVYSPAKATWYGPGLYGNRTACGATLSHRTLGVAHKRLPCGTKVALRYRGRTVVVPVIDRGPYSRGVEYDLTEATARKLGMTQTSRLGAAPLGR